MTYDRSGGKNPFYGKTHTKEARKRMSEAAKKRTGRRHSEETKRKISESNKRTKSKTKKPPKKKKSKEEIWTPERRARAAEAMRRRWEDQLYRERLTQRAKEFRHTEESKARIAESNRRRKGKLKHSEETKRKISESNVWKAVKGNFKYKGYVNTTKGGRCGYRSLWEKKAMLMLDKDSSVASFSYEAFSVPYTWNGRKRFTIPDLLVTRTTGLKEVVEVKPRGYTYNEKEIAKAEACRKFCKKKQWAYYVWDEKVLWPGLSQSEVRDAVKLLT